MIFVVGPLCFDPLSYYQNALTISNDLMIALDGGAQLFIQLGILPDIWIGDMDSSDMDMVSFLRKEKVPIHCYPQEKDFSDFELSLPFIQDHTPCWIHLFGMLGGRLDHMMFNIEIGKALIHKGFLLKFCSEGLDLYMIGSAQELSISSQSKGYVSLLPLDGPARVSSNKNLKYPLQNEMLFPCQSRGLSNELLSGKANIRCNEGKLLIYHYKEV